MPAVMADSAGEKSIQEPIPVAKIVAVPTKAGREFLEVTYFSTESFERRAYTMPIAAKNATVAINKMMPVEPFMPTSWYPHLDYNNFSCFQPYARCATFHLI